MSAQSSTAVREPTSQSATPRSKSGAASFFDPHWETWLERLLCAAAIFLLAAIVFGATAGSR